MSDKEAVRLLFTPKGVDELLRRKLEIGYIVANGVAKIKNKQDIRQQNYDNKT